MSQADHPPSPQGAPPAPGETKSVAERPPTTGFLLPALLAVLLALPALLCSYLPAIDLPQHVAITTMLSRLHDPTLGFADHYVQRPGSLYLLPYLMALGLGHLVPLKRALYVVVFLSLVLYPLAVVYLTRQRQRAAPVALLALPLCYHQMFFWGFVHFTLAAGLAFLCIGLLRQERPTWRTEALLLLLCVALVGTHIYGPLFVLGYLALGLLFGEQRPRSWSARRAPALLVLVLGALLWLRDLGAAPASSGYAWLPASMVVGQIHRSILGGYQDSTEALLLSMLLLCFVLCSRHSLPVSRAKWRALEPRDRVVYAYLALNLLLYFVLPLSTPSAKVLNPRHAVLAAMLLPLVAGEARAAPRRLSGLLCWVLAGATLLNSWGHLWLFDREARSFDAIIEAAPQRPSVVQLNLNPYGEIMANYPYVHFSAYLQAAKGGLIAVSFPRAFWNLPVAFREDGRLPPTPFNFDIKPNLFSEEGFGHAYDHALVRSDSVTYLPSARFPFELMQRSGPWQLYRRVPAPPAPPARGP